MTAKTRGAAVHGGFASFTPKDTHDSHPGSGAPAAAPLHLTVRAWRLISFATCLAGALLLLAAGHLGQTSRCHHLQPGTTAFHTYCAPEAHR